MVRNSRPMDLPDDGSERRGVDRRAAPPEKWHLKKELSMSLIVVLLGYGFLGVQAFFKHERDIELLKAGQAANFTILSDADIAMVGNFKDALSQLREQYNQLNAKLDRLIETKEQKPIRR